MVNDAMQHKQENDLTRKYLESLGHVLSENAQKKTKSRIDAFLQ